MVNMTPRKLLRSMQGSTYDTYPELQEAVRIAFNKKVVNFPPGYNYFDIIERGEQMGWIRKRGGKFIITFDQDKSQQHRLAHV